MKKLWGLHVTCLTTISTGRGFGVSWEWAGVMAMQALIGSMQFSLFRLMSCSSLVFVQLYFGMKARCLGCSHSLHITSWKLTERSFTGSETHTSLCSSPKFGGTWKSDHLLIILKSICNSRESNSAINGLEQKHLGDNGPRFWLQGKDECAPFNKYMYVHMK